MSSSTPASCNKFWSRIEAIVEASGDFIEQMCMQYAYKFFWNFYSNVWTLTIYFIVLDVSVGLS